MPCRKKLEIISQGTLTPISAEHDSVFAYTRSLEGQRLSVVANFTDSEVLFDVPEELAVSGTVLSYNVAPREMISQRLQLAPYEAFAVLGYVAQTGISD